MNEAETCAAIPHGRAVSFGGGINQLARNSFQCGVPRASNDSI